MPRVSLDPSAPFRSNLRGRGGQPKSSFGASWAAAAAGRSVMRSSLSMRWTSPEYHGRLTWCWRMSDASYAVLELAVVLRLVVVAERCRDEAVVSDRPLLESADPDPPPRSTWAGVRAYERPAVFGGPA